MSNQKPLVHLRVYKSSGNGSRISYDEKGNVLNENHLIKLTFGTLEWKETLKNLNIFYVKVDVEKVFEQESNNWVETKSTDLVSQVKKNVDSYVNPKAVVELTPEQKRIADLEAKLEALTSGKTPIREMDVEDAQIVDELSIARQEYQDHFGKKGHHSWSAEQIREKIEEDIKSKS